MQKTTLFLIILLIASLHVNSQNTDSVLISNIYKNALTSHESYNNLKLLCDSAGPRLIGSEGSVIAVKILHDQLKVNNFDKVYLQAFKSNVWQNNSKARVIVSSKSKSEISLEVDVLGPSVSTKSSGISAGVLQVKSIEELESLDKKEIMGKIIFYNTPMKNTFSNPLDAYVEARMLRFNGTSIASKYGAIGVLMRSLTTSIDEFPHTGSIIYDDHFKRIPAVVISSKDSEVLSKLLNEDPALKTTLFVDTKIINDVKSHNIIAEIKGKTNPEEIIIIGAHIDSWHNSPGAQDDGAGCVQMMDVLRIFKELNIKNNKTIRVILFMDEEINRAGAQAYAKNFNSEKETIIVGIESDLGGYSPNGFLIDGLNPVINQIQAYKKQLLPYGLYNIDKGFGGMDILTLKKKYDFPSIALRVESQRYFEIIHTINDTFDKVHQRELQLGTAAIASLVYLLDKYGIEK
jgi:carboxypeptidase Q